MKNVLFSLLLVTLSLGSVTAQTADEAAIRTAIESESKAFHTNTDRTAFIGFWHITPESRMVYQGLGEINLLTGEAMKAAVAAGQLPAADNAERVFSNFVVKANGTIGWASFDQISTKPDGKAAYMREFRCMEKIGTAWKIVSSSVHEYKP